MDLNDLTATAVGAFGPTTIARYDGIWRSGMGLPAKSRCVGLLIQRAHRTERARRALSVEMPVFAYICR